jgi:hypothetical protein
MTQNDGLRNTSPLRIGDVACFLEKTLERDIRPCQKTDRDWGLRIIPWYREASKKTAIA